MQEHARPGTFCWVGLAAADRARALAFYGGLFGWRANEYSAGEFGRYAIMLRGDDPVAIVYRQTAAARAAAASPHWTSYIAVRDIAAAAGAAASRGGTIVREPLPIGDAGRVAAIRDPAGAILSLWEPGAQGVAPVTGALGALCFNELVTADVDAAQRFYGELFEWTFTPDGDGRTVVRDDRGQERAAMREPAAPERAFPPNWLPYIGVANAAAVAVAARHAHGREVMTGRPRAGRPTAVLADPDGAAFAVIEL